MKLLMLSSTFASSDQTTRLELGVSRYLNKPVRRADLFRVIATTMTEMPSGSPVQPRPEAPKAQMEGHILLVEDNPINQYVAAAMLRKFGLVVSLAANGAEAVDLVRNQAFDLILMDCQMPKMDGFTATRHIRAREVAEGLAPIPIIALTANAMAGDREACLAAGMSDYLAKPIAAARLSEVLERHMPQTHVPTSADVGSTMADMSRIAPPIFDASILAALPMVADGSQPEFFNSVLEQFLKSSAELLELYERAAGSADDKSQLRCVHTLKSSSAQVGALALAAVAEEMERCMRAGQSLSAGAIARLKVEHRQASDAIVTQLGMATMRSTA